MKLHMHKLKITDKKQHIPDRYHCLLYWQQAEKIRAYKNSSLNQAQVTIRGSK